MTQQLSLFSPPIIFPTTRYQGSKRKLVKWVWEHLRDLEFETVLDAFGGTGAVSHFLKAKGKTVTYNDNLAFNYQIGLALIENSQVTLTEDDLEALLNLPSHCSDFIQKTFQNIYFTDEENAWLDRIICNINQLENKYKKALAYFALFQACIIKRPYNLFHRANLYMREAKVRRSFGNKITWDTPFETHFRNFAQEANRAVFDNGKTHTALNRDVFDTPTGFDLVYLDPPYLNKNGVGVDYRDFYHFLEGIVAYDTWAINIDYVSKHRRLIPENNIWNHAATIINAFEQVIARHQDSILVISYRDDGIPAKEVIVDLLQKYKRSVQVAELPKQYVLSKQLSHEILLLAV